MMRRETQPPGRKWGPGIFALLPISLAVGLGALFFWGLSHASSDLQSPLIGRAVPEFSLAPIEGMENGLATADLIGQVSLVNVWASWCVPCRTENPLMVELAQSGQVPVYGINYKDEAKDALAFLEELGDPFTRIGADRSGRVSIDWGVYGVPETYIIDAEGRIAYKHIGPFDRQVLRDTILPIVVELQSKEAAS